MGPDAAPVKVKDINLHKLNRKVRRGLSPTHAALLAYELETGTLRLYGLPRHEACRHTHASASYVATIARATAEERAALKRGEIALGQLHNKPKAPPSDAEVDRIIAKIGPDRIMAALDRYTQPHLMAAE
jgi:ethanolamine ammonia-lyase large subunit